MSKLLKSIVGHHGFSIYYSSVIKIMLLIHVISNYKYSLRDTGKVFVPCNFNLFVKNIQSQKPKSQFMSIPIDSRVTAKLS